MGLVMLNGGTSGMNPMTKKELLQFLASLPIDSDDYLIVLSSDGEGNSFSPLADMDIGLYLPDNTYSGEILMGEDIEPGERENCIVLWPVN